MSETITQTCDHLDVHIKGIVKSWDRKTQMRVIKGTCQNCSREVHRDDYPLEINQPDWRTP